MSALDRQSRLVDPERDESTAGSRIWSLAIAGGGTGGHVYPALAIVAAVRNLSALTRVTYFGGQGGMERPIVERAGLPFTAVSVGAIRGRGPVGKLTSLLRLGIGTAGALLKLRRCRASAVLATGGYACVPVIIAAWLLRIPRLIYLPDVEPGLAVRFLARIATKIAVTSPASRQFLPQRKVVVSGYPVREELLNAPGRLQARAKLGIPDEAKVLLVVGGSRGARSINYAVMASLPELLPRAFVLHSSGERDEASLRQSAATLPPGRSERYRLSAYWHEDLAVVMAAADLAISRAGASVMGEYPIFGLPSVLVPYPYAGAHQERNAAYLTQAGAAIELPDGRLGDLPTVVATLLTDEAKLAAMRTSAHQLAQPRAAQRIAEELQALCSKQ